MAGIQLKGFKEFDKKLKNLPLELKKEVGGETFAAAKMWEQRAKRAAPVDQGRLRGSIRGNQRQTSSPDFLGSSEVTANTIHAAWLEWGTKKRVKVPAELSAYAATFRGGGTGGGKAKQMIFAWMNRVGIPKDRQWITFISIITNGIKPQPYFFIQRQPVEKEFIKNVRNILNTEH
jgi:HK97 gp10 family phage protein